MFPVYCVRLSEEFQGWMMVCYKKKTADVGIFYQREAFVLSIRQMIRTTMSSTASVTLSKKEKRQRRRNEAGLLYYCDKSAPRCIATVSNVCSGL